ncbi:MAG TPA: glycoside hydrolase family 15 protein [Candidatus Dormibacteraeota bacterium]|nr:glycoside hydrolase family 15 protein [Candidatus Dormibacteraeota bacterium]
MSQPHGRYPPIGDYGMIGDLRSAALVSKGGSVDWMCLPRFDSPWVFGRLLDWDRGGFLQLVPADPGASIYREYRRDSNVLQTIWSLDRARMRVVDFMPLVLPRKKLKPPASLRLIRMMQPLAGRTTWTLTFKPRFDFGRAVPSLHQLRPGLLAAQWQDARLFLQYPDDAALELADGVASVNGHVLPGHRAAILLHYVEDRTVPATISIDETHALLHQTDDYWRDWLRSTTYQGRFDEPLHRSALALKLMQYQPSGAFVAAPTTSLPESPGGSLNWDYRYSWIRDTSDLVNALFQMGFHDEADRFIRWVRMAHDRHPERFQVMYTIDGDDRIPEYVLEDLEGYRGSRPVRIGNAAVEQLQLDIYGEVLQTVYTVWRTRRRLPRPRRRVVLDVIDYILENWQAEDSGIWESRRRPRRYLYSQVLMWCGLDRVLRMDQALRMGEQREARVRRTRDAIKRQVLERGFNRQLGAFTQALDSDDLDATALAIPMYEMLPATDPRVMSTVKVLQEKLTINGFLYRYVPEESEFHEPEGAFIICTLWLVNVLAQMGRMGEAEELFSRVTETANDLGLFAEEYDPKTEEMLGNFPQALTHLSVITAVFNLEGRPSGKSRRSGQGNGR